LNAKNHRSLGRTVWAGEVREHGTLNRLKFRSKTPEGLMLIFLNVLLISVLQILDEVYRILIFIRVTPLTNRGYWVTDELFDLTTMAMEYFKEHIEPTLPEITYFGSDLLEFTNFSSECLLNALSIFFYRVDSLRNRVLCSNIYPRSKRFFRPNVLNVLNMFYRFI